MLDLKKTFILLGVAIAILAAFLFFNQKQVQNRRGDSFIADSTLVNDVVTVKLMKGKDTIILEKISSKWTVSPDSFPADTSKLNKVLAGLFKLQDKELVSVNAARQSEYGLDSASGWDIVCSDASKKELLKVIVGKTAGTDYVSIYFKRPGKNEVFRSPGNFATDIEAGTDTWKNKKLFELEGNKVHGIDVAWKDSLGKEFNFSLSKEKEKWISSDGNPIKKDLVEQMATRMSEMNIDEFVKATDTNIVKANLENPAVKISVKTQDGKSFTLAGSKAIDGYMYAKHPSRNMAIKISNWRLDAFTKKPSELIDSTALKSDSTQVQKTLKAMPGIKAK